MVCQLWFFYELSCGWIWLSVRVWLFERTVLSSGCLVGLWEGDPILLHDIQV